MALLEIAEKHANGEFLKELGQWTLQRLMELEANQECGAERHERSPDRVNRRGGCLEGALIGRVEAGDELEARGDSGLAVDRLDVAVDRVG